MKTIDLKKTFKDLYRATRKTKEVDVAKATYLAADGVGEPGGEAFQHAIDGLFALGYTAKFTLKAQKIIDFSVPTIEALWPEADYASKPRSEWRWRLLLRIPDELTAALLRPVRTAILARKGLDTRFVKRVSLAEGRCLQVLHVGPYEDVGKVYERLGAEAAARGLAPRRHGHEIYLSDPRRVPPERLKTIVRLPVGRASKKSK
jgi:hypothetical protein